MKLKIKFRNLEPFYLMVILIAFNQAISDSAAFTLFYGIFKNGIIILIAILALVQVASLRNINYKQGIIFILLIMSLITSAIIASTWLVYLFVILFFGEKKSINKLIKCIIIPAGLVFFINMFLFIYYYFADRTNLEFIVQYGDQIRYFMFYNSPNGAARNLIFLVLGYFYLKNDKTTIFNYIFILGITFIVYNFTKSDSLILIFAIIFLFAFKDKLEKQVRWIVKRMYWIELALSYIVLCLTSTRIFMIIDTFLVGRLSHSMEVFRKYGFSIVGQSADLGYQYVEDKFTKLICDNAFYYTPIKYGIIYLVFISVVVLSIRKFKLVNEENICILIYFLYMLIENRIFDFPVAFPFIILAIHWMEIPYNEKNNCS